MELKTPRYQQAEALAQKEAKRLGHEYVGPEHLLIGILGVINPRLADVATSLGLNLEAASFVHNHHKRSDEAMKEIAKFVPVEKLEEMKNNPIITGVFQKIGQCSCPTEAKHWEAAAKDIAIALSIQMDKSK